MKILLFDSNKKRSEQFQVLFSKLKGIKCDHETDIYNITNFNVYDLIIAHETDIESDGDLFHQRRKLYEKVLIRFSGGFSANKGYTVVSEKEITINDTVLLKGIKQFLIASNLNFSAFTNVDLKTSDKSQIKKAITEHSKLKEGDFSKIINFLKTKNKTILFADDDLPDRITTQENGNLLIANDFYKAKELIAKQAKKIEIAILDIEFIKQAKSGIDLLKDIKKRNNKVKVIMLSGYDNFEMSFKSYFAGADYFISKQNLNFSYLNTIIDVIHIDNFPVIVGKSKKMLSMYEDIAFYAKFNEDVLILGENGTGKELVAKSLCQLDTKSEKFITKNCAGIPETLFESEMFGYVKGAFTGALDKGKPSPFEEADNGVLFLDEIGDMPKGQQAKLLRLIQEKKVIRLGSFEGKRFNTRLIYATNKNLHEEIENNNFRMDFFYRISGAVITIPPLRERIEDLEMLIAFFCNKFLIKNKNSINMDKAIKLDKKSLKSLRNYQFPGNIRELEKIVYQSMLNMLKKENSILQLANSDNLNSGSQINLKDNFDEIIIALLENKQIMAKGLTSDTKKRIVSVLKTQNRSTKNIAELFGISEQSFRNLEVKLNSFTGSMLN